MTELSPYSSKNQDWIDGGCDKYDYLASACCGTLAGVIDIFFVGLPGNSVLGNWTDSQIEEGVKKFARLTDWKPRQGNEENVRSAIGHLEKKYKINYDMKSTTDVGDLFAMGTTNHHFKSLGHSPDLIGLFFSILDQFTHKASFLSDGKLIRIEAESQDLGLYGDTLIARIFCGFCNWFGHIMSDIAGSSGSTIRGTGVPAPFMALFQLCDFGELQVEENRQTLATVMTEVFQEGYDARFAAATAIPVVINDLLITVIWVVRRHFQKNIEWKDCIPNKKHSDLRMMKLVGVTTFCAMDAGDAALKSGGNAAVFILRMNYVAWLRLVVLVFKELIMRYGDQVIPAFNRFMQSATPSEQKLINDFKSRINEQNKELGLMVAEYVTIMNKEYLDFHNTLEIMYNEAWHSMDERCISSIHMAKENGVEKPFETMEEMREFFKS